MSKHLWKPVKCAFNILFVLLMLSGGMGIIPSPVQAAQGGNAPVLLQFTSGGSILGFATDGMIAATGSHVLDVDFIEANNTQHSRSGTMPQTDVPESTSTSNSIPTDTLSPPLFVLHPLALERLFNAPFHPLVR